MTAIPKYATSKKNGTTGTDAFRHAYQASDTCLGWFRHEYTLEGKWREKLVKPVSDMLCWVYRRINTENKRMTRWNLSISEKTDRLVRSHLARVGMKKGDLSKFVDTAVRKEILRRTVQEVQAQNADLSEEEAMALANEAVAWARAHPS